MTVRFECVENWAGDPKWHERSMTESDGRFTIRKTRFGIEMSADPSEFECFGKMFTHAEFDEFVKACQWVAACPVKEDRA